VLTEIHRQLYRRNFFKTIRVSKPVISVGNLTFGGTGKTPFVRELISEIQNMGLRPAIVVKNYKASSLVSTLLDQEKAQYPDVWGDEACWYFQKTSSLVYSGPLKWVSAKLAAENPDVDVIVVDDGFQHHKLERDLNIILIDALAGIEGLKKQARDGVKSLAKTDWVVLTRANLVDSNDLQKLKTYLNSAGQLFSNWTVGDGVKAFSSADSSEFKEGRSLLVSGIANPRSFELVFKHEFPNAEVVRLDFDDHHAYSQGDLNQIENSRIKNKLDFVVMTEKDEVKFRKLKDLNGDLSPIQVSVVGVFQIKSKFEKPQEWVENLRRFLISKGLAR
jgi:tetraacyldisaccharide 4'-kinase